MARFRRPQPQRNRPVNAGNRNASIPTPLAPAAPVLNFDGLSAAYEWMTIDKLVGLKLALEWYDAAREPKQGPSPLLYLAPLDAAQQKLYEMAVKVRGVADGTPYVPEKITFLEKTIRLFEQIWIKKIIVKLDNAVILKNAAVISAQRLFNNLNEAFGAYGVNYRLAQGTDRSFLAGEVLVPMEEALRLAAVAPLKVILDEIRIAAQVKSTTPAGFNGSAFMGNLADALTAAYGWAEKANNILKAGKAAPAARAAARGNRAARVTAVGNLPKDKGAAALALMRRGGGATINEILAATGWTLGSLQSFVSNTRKKGTVIKAAGAGVTKFYEVV